MTIALIYPYEETSVIAVPFHLAFNIKVAAAGFLIKVYLISSSSWRMGPLAWGGLRLNPGSQDPITVTDTTTVRIVPDTTEHYRALYVENTELWRMARGLTHPSSISPEIR